MQAVVRTLRSCPLALAMVGTLVATALVLRADPDVASDLVRWSSTNVHNLGHHPIGSMILSAFVVPGGLGHELLIVGLSFAALERLLGAAWTAIVGMSGHVLATLATELGVGAGIYWHVLPSSDLTREDVGISYVMYAVLAGLVAMTSGRLRWALGIALASVLVSQLIASPGMTTTGHLLTMVVGFAVGLYARKRRRDSRESPAGENHSPPQGDSPSPWSGGRAGSGRFEPTPR